MSTVSVQSAVFAKAVGLRPAPFGAAAWLLTVGAVVISTAIGGVYPSPGESAVTVASYFRVEQDAVTVSALLTSGSTIPLLLFLCALAMLLARAHASAMAVLLVAAAGGVGIVFVALSAGGLWVLSRPETTTDAATLHMVSDAVFVTGGPLFAQMIGIVCLAVATSTRTGPGSLRPGLNRAGFVIGAAGLCGVLGLVWSPLLVLMPVARFGGLGWLTAVSFVLGRRVPTPVTAAKVDGGAR